MDQIEDMMDGAFQSTLSLRRATVTQIISAARLVNFNPRSPCGERRCSCSNGTLDL